MNGPQHYAHAEEFAGYARSCWESNEEPAVVAAAAAVAQVHATLALAAATAQHTIEATDLDDLDANDWLAVITGEERAPKLRAVKP